MKVLIQKRLKKMYQKLIYINLVTIYKSTFLKYAAPLRVAYFSTKCTASPIEKGNCLYRHIYVICWRILNRYGIE